MIWTAKTMNFAGDDLWKVDVPIDCGWFDELNAYSPIEWMFEDQFDLFTNYLHNEISALLVLQNFFLKVDLRWVDIIQDGTIYYSSTFEV